MRILAIGLHTETDPFLETKTTTTVFLDTATGEIQPLMLLATAVVTGEGGYLVGCHLYTQVGRLHEMFCDFPQWTIQVAAGKGRKLVHGRGRRVTGAFLPVYFGFVEPKNNRQTAKGGRNKRSYRSPRASRLFHCLDLHELVSLQTVTLTDCIHYAESIISLCAERGVTAITYKGGMAARLLKASPLWDRERHAAPEFVNDRVREYLPGNYYGLSAPLRKNHPTALYVDQVSSHHAVAASTPIPHPMHVRARGYYQKLDGVWISRTDTEAFHHVTHGYHGLVCARCSVSHIPDSRKHLFPPFLHAPGKRVLFFYTNELDYFDGRHATIDYLIAAWTAPVADPVVPEYARWALEARGGGPGRKAILLAAYGTLAQRSDSTATNYLKWKGHGMRTVLPGSGPFREVMRGRKPGQPQPRHVNVLARGIIEAETRKRSIMFAREMDAAGIPVLSIYVDGLILDTDRLPFLPEGWRLEAHLSNVRWRHPNTWVADEMRKEPGVAQDNTPGDQARRMLAAGNVGTPDGAADRAASRQARNARILTRAQWNERQGVLPMR